MGTSDGASSRGGNSEQDDREHAQEDDANMEEEDKDRGTILPQLNSIFGGMEKIIKEKGDERIKTMERMQLIDGEGEEWGSEPKGVGRRNSQLDELYNEVITEM